MTDLNAPDAVTRRALRSIERAISMQPEDTPPELVAIYRRVMTAVFPVFCTALAIERALETPDQQLFAVVGGLIADMVRELAICHPIGGDVVATIGLMRRTVKVALEIEIAENVWEHHLHAALNEGSDDAA